MITMFSFAKHMASLSPRISTKNGQSYMAFLNHHTSTTKDLSQLQQQDFTFTNSLRLRIRLTLSLTPYLPYTTTQENILALDLQNRLFSSSFAPVSLSASLQRQATGTSNWTRYSADQLEPRQYSIPYTRPTLTFGQFFSTVIYTPFARDTYLEFHQAAASTGLIFKPFDSRATVFPADPSRGLRKFSKEFRETYTDDEFDIPSIRTPQGSSSLPQPSSSSSSSKSSLSRHSSPPSSSSSSSSSSSTTTASSTPSPSSPGVVANGGSFEGGGAPSHSSPSSPRKEPPATAPLQTIQIHRSGTVLPVPVQKSDLASDLALNLRDMRTVDPSFRAESASILTRRTAILIHLDYLRAIIMRDTVVVFDIGHPTVQRFLPKLMTRLHPANLKAHPMPFELCAVEAMLIGVCATLDTQMKTLAPAVDSALDALTIGSVLGSDALMQSLDRVLPLENALNEFQRRVMAVRRAMYELLESDEDMCQMYLTANQERGHVNAVNEHEEVEMMFENYLKQIDSINSEITSLMSSINATEKVTQIRLQAMRNRILRLEVYLSVTTLCTACGALITGIFGMNLLSGFESNPYAFYVTVASVGLIIGLGLRTASKILDLKVFKG